MFTCVHLYVHVHTMHTLSSDPTSLSIFAHLVWGLEFRRCLREEKVEGVAEGQDVPYPGRLGQEVLGGKKQKPPKKTVHSLQGHEGE